MKSISNKASGFLEATLALVVLAWPARARVITEFPIPRPGSGPLQIASGPSGVWFTELAVKRIGLITFDGKLVEFSVGRPLSAIVQAPDGNPWFMYTGVVSRMSSNSQMERNLEAHGSPVEISLRNHANESGSHHDLQRAGDFIASRSGTRRPT